MARMCAKDLFKKYLTTTIFKGEKSRMITFLVLAMTVSTRHQSIQPGTKQKKSEVCKHITKGI